MRLYSDIGATGWPLHRPGGPARQAAPKPSAVHLPTRRPDPAASRDRRPLTVVVRASARSSTYVGRHRLVPEFSAPLHRSSNGLPLRRPIGPQRRRPMVLPVAAPIRAAATSPLRVVASRHMVPAAVLRLFPWLHNIARCRYRIGIELAAPTAAPREDVTGRSLCHLAGLPLPPRRPAPRHRVAVLSVSSSPPVATFPAIRGEDRDRPAVTALRPTAPSTRWSSPSCCSLASTAAAFFPCCCPRFPALAREASTRPTAAGARGHCPFAAPAAPLHPPRTAHRAPAHRAAAAASPAADAPRCHCRWLAALAAPDRTCWLAPRPLHAANTSRWQPLTCAR
nr:uncharacterized protein LOC120972692 [Aegilops tauschii subsp. strangulata]